MNHPSHHLPVERRKILKTASALALSGLVPFAARAQAFPDKPVKIMLGYAAGGTADYFVRIVAQHLGTEFRQPFSFIVENKPGASGNIAATQVARSPADGYTLLFGNTAEMAVNRHLMANTGFDVEKDFKPVAAVNDVPLVLVVSTASPIKTLADLIAAAKKPDTNVSFASAGRGSPGHLAGEALAQQAGMNITHVPYKGASPALVDVIAGHVTFYFSGLTAVSQYVKAGSVRILAITSQKRSRFAKEVPTVSELMKTDFNFTLWGGFFAPSKTPAAIVQVLNARVNKVLAIPEVVAQMAREGSEVTQGTPDAFGAFVKKESERYQKVVKALGYKPE
jgi:tripartite-type tricarboxylate transporter receptor subunit TctC